jgi:hypothetical protein
MTKRVPNGIWQSETDKMAERKGEGEEKKIRHAWQILIRKKGKEIRQTWRILDYQVRS